MNEEEKKAIEILQHYLEMKEFDSAEDFLISIDKVLNLIKRQQKEIEVLEIIHINYEVKVRDQQKEIEELKQITTLYNAYKSPSDERKIVIADSEYFEKGFFKENSILKAKIKGKIKGLEKQQEENRKELYNAINSANFRKIDMISNRISKNIIERDILKELLEE